MKLFVFILLYIIGSIVLMAYQIKYNKERKNSKKKKWTPSHKVCKLKQPAWVTK
ncbi:hypothetical protein Bcop_0867 [Bacteroides coprosuis DSM 18011]|uniref:Uncharacterized protein n=1 Tax=Bacteroides coprosuis DSM 18011 TaxID=679937 RepID=F3ZTI9_9BACE|nr:hypothetical protein Bcop_0867 [Bacteroides coprosuis DSM 18011]